ncbi:unnamed protein product [Penicillium olsonii]|nr:unnamed protein product [Penicillium olsonii]CAG7929827.1 unnamed protein product [Penicillium olsonii]
MSDSEDGDWQQVRTYTDHIGHRVVLEQFVEPEFAPDDVHLVPFQVYSLVPLDDHHEQLREYLMQSFIDEELKPLFEIYSYCLPDTFACIEHNHWEIARRKQLHQSGVENASPLIPQFPRRSNGTLGGFCILIRSHSYRFGQDEDGYTQAGEGPDLLFFNRSSSNMCNDIDETQRISEVDNPTSEAFELATQRVTKQYNIGQILMLDIFLKAGRPDLQYALDIDEGEPPQSNPPLKDQIRDRLNQETAVGGFFTVRLFTASIVSYLPANKIFNFKFCIPNSHSWSAIRPAQTEALSYYNQENPFTIGALHTFSVDNEQSSASYRSTPQQSDKYFASAKQTAKTPFRLFTVALDRPKFVSKAGVYFYMAEFDTSGDPDPYLEVCSDDTQVFRVEDMSTVAGRLGVVVLDE